MNLGDITVMNREAMGDKKPTTLEHFSKQNTALFLCEFFLTVFSRLHFHFCTLWKLKKTRKNLPVFESDAIASDDNFRRW